MNARIEVIQGDITQLDVDVIVNAANEGLRGGGGVDGAIHRAAGSEPLQAACREIGFCATGQACVTPGFNLKAKWIVHAVGPVWRGGHTNEDALLAGCYASSLRLAEDQGAQSIAFPCISTGVYGFPFKRARDIAIREVRTFAERGTLERILFCCFSASDAESYREILVP